MDPVFLMPKAIFIFIVYFSITALLVGVVTVIKIFWKETHDKNVW